MTIRDDGPGFTPVAKSKRQGVGLVQRLIEQVRGTAVIEMDRGAAWIIRFPIAHVADEWPVPSHPTLAAAAD